MQCEAGTHRGRIWSVTYLLRTEVRAHGRERAESCQSKFTLKREQAHELNVQTR